MSNSPLPSRRTYAAPDLEVLDIRDTKSGIVILPIEILGIQGPS
jgi:hypothetical protein